MVTVSKIVETVKTVEKKTVDDVKTIRQVYS